MDYVFSATFIRSDFIHIYFHTVFSEKQIPNKIFLTWMIANDLFIWKLTCWCVFLNKREVLSRFFEKSTIFKYFSTCQKRSDDFWIMNALCTFIYLFIVYFSFAPVISASIHRYVNYFDIQVLMMVTVTEKLTSTLHHNIFTYMDYIFFLLPSYIYIYIYIYRQRSCRYYYMDAPHGRWLSVLWKSLTGIAQEYIEQILKPTLHKTAAVWPPNSHP